MVTVAIVGILAGIAIPGYQDSVRKSRRADVEGVLLNLANSMERYFTETNSYCDAANGGTAETNCGAGTGDTGTPSIFTIPNEIITFYTITISAASANTYTLSAAPTGSQSNDKCGTLTLTNTGVKGVSLASVSECW